MKTNCPPIIKCNYCNKVIKYKHATMDGITHHYNWVTKKDEYYHKSCRRIMLLLSGEAWMSYNLGE